MQNMVTNFFGWICDLVLDNLTDFLTGMLQSFLDFATRSSDGFWSMDAMTTILDTASKFNSIMWFIGFLMIIFDMADAYAEQKGFIEKSAGESLLNGLAFAIVSPQICKYSMLTCTDLLASFRLNDAATADTNYQFIITFLGVNTGGLGWVIAILGGIIACGAFMVMTLRRFGYMIVQTLTTCLYVIPITRGDNQALEGWIRQTAALILTYVFQYFLFWFGWYMVVSDMTAGGLVAIGCWLAMGGVPRILDKFGLSVSHGSLIGTVSQISMIARGFM